jgi:hypothetical protein
MTAPAPSARPQVCGAQTYLPAALVPLAVRLGAADHVTELDVQRDLRCTLEAHATGEHWALVLDLDGPDTGSVWTYWPAGGLPEKVATLPDCPDERGCTEYAGHPGGHTSDVHDPWADLGNILSR